MMYGTNEIAIEKYLSAGDVRLSCHVTSCDPQLTVVVGAVGLTATNLEQDIIFIHSYQKPVSYAPASLVLFYDVINSFRD